MRDWPAAQPPAATHDTTSKTMIDDEIIIAAEIPNTPDVRHLLAERDAYFDRLYAGEDRQSGVVDVKRDDLAFFSVRASSRLIGCGTTVMAS
jgi:hypothetical protein